MGRPDYADYTLAVRDYLSDNGIDLNDAIARGDVLAVSKTLLSANTAINVSKAEHENKRQAQTISGASMRPAVVDPSTAEWEAIKNTNPSGYQRIGILPNH